MPESRLSPDVLLKSGPAMRGLATLGRPLAPWLPEGIFMFHQGRCGSTVLSRLQDLVHHGQVWSVEGPAYNLTTETICLHADTPGAVHLARAIWAALAAAGISLRRLDRADT